MADYSGVALLFIGANVFLNALWLQDKVAAKDVAIINLIAAFMGISASFYAALRQDNLVFSAAFLLFAFTFLWVGVNALRGQEDQRAVGWYSLLVAIIAVLYVFINLQAGLYGWAISWVIYGILWLLFWLLLGLQKPGVLKLTIAFAYITGILVMITGLLTINGWQGALGFA